MRRAEVGIAHETVVTVALIVGDDEYDIERARRRRFYGTQRTHRREEGQCEEDEGEFQDRSAVGERVIERSWGAFFGWRRGWYGGLEAEAIRPARRSRKIVAAE